MWRSSCTMNRAMPSSLAFRHSTTADAFDRDRLSQTMQSTRPHSPEKEEAQKIMRCIFVAHYPCYLTASRGISVFVASVIVLPGCRSGRCSGQVSGHREWRHAMQWNVMAFMQCNVMSMTCSSRPECRLTASGVVKGNVTYCE